MAKVIPVINGPKTRKVVLADSKSNRDFYPEECTSEICAEPSELPGLWQWSKVEDDCDHPQMVRKMLVIIYTCIRNIKRRSFTNLNKSCNDLILCKLVERILFPFTKVTFLRNKG